MNVGLHHMWQLVTYTFKATFCCLDSLQKQDMMKHTGVEQIPDMGPIGPRGQWAPCSEATGRMSPTNRPVATTTQT